MTTREPRVLKSPSGKYTLTITAKESGPGRWNTIEALVEGGPTPAHLTHSYSSFPHRFIEGHANGHDYLVSGGVSYQGQSVVELDTGRHWDRMSKGAEKGHGFCWSSIDYDPGQQMLVVGGCYWACPYEHRFFDFSKPEEGWPSIGADVCIDHYDGRRPVIEGNRIKVTHTLDVDYLAERELLEADFEIIEAATDERYAITGTETYEREGLTLRKVEEWNAPAWKAHVEEQARRQAAWDAAWKVYTETDPLYLFIKRHVAAWPGARQDVWMGRYWKDHPSGYLGDDQRLGFVLREYDSERGLGRVELEWGRNEAPVRLEWWPTKDRFESAVFPRTEAGVLAALEKAKEVVS